MTTRGLHVVLPALLLYLVIAPSTILGGDNAEFATLTATGGVAHPSGYPLYVLYLRALSWLPVEPAHAAALATALLGGLQLYLLHAACRAWGARPGAASIAVAIYAVGPLPLLLHTHAEVFALNGVVVAAVLWLSAPPGAPARSGGREREARAHGGTSRDEPNQRARANDNDGPRKGLARVATLGLVAGLGLANHLTCVLVAPVGVLGAVRGVRESGRAPLAIALGVGALALGLAPYAYLLVADGPMAWGSIDTAGDLLDHALRRDYGTFSLGAGVAPVSRADQLAALGHSLARGWWWLPLAAAAWGFARGVSRPGRGAWVGLASALLLAGPVFALASNVPPEGLGLLIVERFHLLPLLLLVIPVARGLDALEDKVRPAIVHAVAVVALLAGAALSWPQVRAAEGPQVELFLRNTLKILPADAVLLGTGDHQGFGYAYLQLARGVRTDVHYIDLEMLGHDWYRARVDARLGFPAIPAGPGLASVRLVEQLVTHGRTVFVDGAGTEGSYQARIVTSVPSYPWGTVIRVVPPGERMPRVDDLEAENAALLEQLAPRGPRPGPDDGWASFVYAKYAAPWKSLGIAYQQAGRDEDAARCFAIFEALMPG